MPTQTYVLLETMDANAPVYQQLPDGKRMQIKKIPVHRPTLRQTFMNEEGKSVTIRYKSNSNTIFQDEQIKEEKIEANERFTTQEYRDPEFKFGILVIPEKKKILQAYIKAHPECEGFKGLCDDVKAPRYKLLDEVADGRIKNADTLKRIKAANKVADMTSLSELQALIIRLNGSFVKTPTEVSDCQNLLWDFIDDHEGLALDDVLKGDKETTVDERTSVLIGKLMNAGKLSFDAVQGKISKKDRSGYWITVRDMSSEYSLDERMRLFSDFLNTTDGKPLKNDLENDLNEKVIVDENNVFESTPLIPTNLSPAIDVVNKIVEPQVALPKREYTKKTKHKRGRAKGYKVTKTQPKPEAPKTNEQNN